MSEKNFARSNGVNTQVGTGLTPTRMALIGDDPARIVRAGITNGWVRFGPPAARTNPKDLERVHRKRVWRAANGLNAAGRRPQKIKRPQLKGLNRREYGTRYMHMVRSAAKQNSMNEHPILFSGPMVQAILEGRKTQTRRVVNRKNSLVDGSPCTNRMWEELDFKSPDVFVDRGPSPAGNPGPYLHVPWPQEETRHRVYFRPAVGDRMYVREAWRTRREWDNRKPTTLPIDADAFADPQWCRDQYITFAVSDENTEKMHGKLRPGIFLPRWASRIVLEIVNIRAERLQSISETDAAAEGVDCKKTGFFTAYNCKEGFTTTAKRSFESLWDSINAKRDTGVLSWANNPWVWVIEFKCV